MSKSIDSGTVVYEIKATNPNAIANYDAGKLVKGIGDDLIAFVGRPIQGLVVKANDATAIVKKVKEDLVGGKCAQPWLRAGMSGKDMIFLVTDLKNAKYERACTLVADYKGIREKQKKLLTETKVYNLDKGDKVIDKAAKDMVKALGVKGDGKGLGEIDGSVSIILLAHGDEDKTASGQIYGKDFAGSSPKDLVALLVDNKDPKKRLNPSYSGTIYLDGCFTAQGGAMQNYTKQVWELLKAKGIKNCKVKGNLGAAATLKSGDELVTTTEAEKAGDKLTAKAQKDYEKQIAPAQAKIEEIWKKKYGGKDKDGFKNDPDVAKLNAAIEKARNDAVKKLEAELKKIPGYEVKNLVGQFGLTRLN
ncbi:hypothetical protein LXT12_12725 [Pelomonas sp. P7]|uniref:Caspase domain-containing protein n=1 Tax=Pelomonas caseinilytica TaxID=2906763 RepID=A0ABS8XEG5_9BURK|nr:hypothetical protein [Pelomonas sp. P7]MCE4538115.1 hypothetical protein [Pelomonas sp. P7]